jgi:catechol 2,3-dioxygenase-like lactoylglutathione lyase family enzyme
VSGPNIESISAVTLHVTDMARSFRFYDALGFELRYGGADAAFTSFSIGRSFLNLQLVTDPPGVAWGRTILHVDDVDAQHDRCVAAGHTPEAPPADAPWGERYFHIRDPDGHELSFARYL